MISPLPSPRHAVALPIGCGMGAALVGADRRVWPAPSPGDAGTSTVSRPGVIPHAQGWRGGSRTGPVADQRGTGTTTRRPTALGLIVLVLTALLLLAPSGVAFGQSGATPAPDAPYRAGLVIRHGDGRLTYATVPFAEPSISGLELLRRGLAAGNVPLVTIGFGGLGEGVCQIADEGCPAGECRRRLCQGPRPDDPYWRYFRQTAPGDWRPLPLGASGTTVEDGDVDAWSWTGGDVDLPALTLADVARLAGAGAEPGSRRLLARTISPPGTPPPAAAERPAWPTYAGAAGILTLIAGGALVAARRRPADRAEPAA